MHLPNGIFRVYWQGLPGVHFQMVDCSCSPGVTAGEIAQIVKHTAERVGVPPGQSYKIAYLRELYR